MKNAHSSDDYPRAGSILDYVRCVIAVLDRKEFESLLKTICNSFEGKILKICNSFKKGMNTDLLPFGYRSVKIYVECSDESDPLLTMICEIEITSVEFYDIFQSMKMYHKLHRSSDAWALAMDVIEDNWINS